MMETTGTNFFLLFSIAMVAFWYLTKITLKDHGYEANWVSGHWRDIPNIFQLARETENQSEKIKYVSMGVTLISGIIVFLIMVFLPSSIA